MTIVWLILLAILNFGLAASIIFGLPGTWLILGTSALAHYLIDPTQAPGGVLLLSKWTLLALVGLAVIGELIEFTASAAGAKYGGASRRGTLGALVGSIVGGLLAIPLIPVPIVGSLIGAAGGACLGAMYGELTGGKAPHGALRAGVGAGIGQVGGRLGKLAVALVMWLVSTVAFFIA